MWLRLIWGLSRRLRGVISARSMNDEQVLKLYRLIKDDMDGLEKRMHNRFDTVERQIDDVRGHIDHLYGEQQTREIEESEAYSQTA